MALRLTIALAVLGQLFVALGILGLLRPWVLVVICVLIIGERLHAETRRGAEKQSLRLPAPPRETVLLIPFALLAAYPPIAFDETLYHLPFVGAIAQSGAINFLPNLRFPVFPQLHEILCVPIFLLFGDTATHFVAVAEVLLLASLLLTWPEQRSTGILAAALVLGNPIVMQIGTVTYVDAALMLFVAAGAYCLDRHPAAAGFLLGTACSVKYLGGYFALAALVYLLLFHEERRRSLL
ncbi:MAG TPA: glycosyltransferase family 39 protein, partial [Thermoanaerobaculia bacterium]|nr:glycosyltransferase family 39 protein [Thermoanaerobaculia bacterium]